jgi:hypothetical protein
VVGGLRQRAVGAATMRDDDGHAVGIIGGAVVVILSGC